MKRYISAAYVTDYLDENDLADMLERTPEFGNFSHYQQKPGMIVETTKWTTPGVAPMGGSTVRQFKFVSTDDGWEAYEIDKAGRMIGQAFSCII